MGKSTVSTGPWLLTVAISVDPDTSRHLGDARPEGKGTQPSSVRKGREVYMHTYATICAYNHNYIYVCNIIIYINIYITLYIYR